VFTASSSNVRPVVLPCIKLALYRSLDGRLGYKCLSKVFDLLTTLLRCDI
jgi:hypothetical protein